MRLNFNVLWVEDQPDRVGAQIRSIAAQMETHGFDFTPTLCRTMGELRKKLGDNVFNDEVDLIMVDWDLGSEGEGQDAISEIREAIHYRDVIFYSAMTTADALRKLASDRDLEGYYCARREDLIDEVMGAFEALVRKVLDLDHTRGIVMGATSDIDFIVRDCLSTLHQKLSQEDQALLIAGALKRIDERNGSASKKAQKLRDKGTLSDILAAHLVFSAKDALRLLSSLLKNQAIKPNFGKHRDAVVAYMDEIVDERNILGHQVLTPQGKASSVIDGKGAEVGLDEMRKLRCRLLELRREFRTLHASAKN